MEATPCPPSPQPVADDTAADDEAFSFPLSAAPPRRLFSRDRGFDGTSTPPKKSHDHRQSPRRRVAQACPSPQDASPRKTPVSAKGANAGTRLSTPRRSSPKGANAGMWPSSPRRRSSLGIMSSLPKRKSSIKQRALHVLLRGLCHKPLVLLHLILNLWVLLTSMLFMNFHGFTSDQSHIHICFPPIPSGHANNNATAADAPTYEGRTVNVPQQLCFGPYRERNATDAKRGRPFVTQDCWADLVDNERTFYLRPEEAGMPTMEELAAWIRTMTHPITLVMNNQADKSWPANLDNNDYELVLNERNLHAIYATNPRRLKSLNATLKLKPLPIGMKWNWNSTQLFSEPKENLTRLYSENVATTPQQAEALFRSRDRTPTVFLRHMTNSSDCTSNTPAGFFRHTTNSDDCTSNYARDTQALRDERGTLLPLFRSNLYNNTLKRYGELDKPEYFAKLRKHRFVVSPAGNGLDSHSTWEALLAGCIPIVPKSPLDPLFDDLPVWLVESWKEVTEQSLVDKLHNMTKEGRIYKWEKLFVTYWEEEIYRGL